jgi:hypothetical protein
LLCSSCNMSFGSGREDARRFECLAAYARKHAPDSPGVANSSNDAARYSPSLANSNILPFRQRIVDTSISCQTHVTQLLSCISAPR